MNNREGDLYHCLVLRQLPNTSKCSFYFISVFGTAYFLAMSFRGSRRCPVPARCSRKCNSAVLALHLSDNTMVTLVVRQFFSVANAFNGTKCCVASNAGAFSEATLAPPESPRPRPTPTGRRPGSTRRSRKVSFDLSFLAMIGIVRWMIAHRQRLHLSYVSIAQFGMTYVM